VAGEQDDKIVGWITPALVTADRKVQEINPGKHGNYCADKESCIKQPVIPGGFGYTFHCRHSRSPILDHWME